MTTLRGRSPLLTSGDPYWAARNPTTAAYPHLTGDLACDVAVVGGGITGALMAYRLVAAGFDVVLLDQGIFGAESTSASTALIGYEYDLMLSDLIEAVGEKHAVRAYELSYSATSSLKGLVDELEDPCDHEDKEGVRIYGRDTDRGIFEKEARLRNQHGFAVETLDERQLATRFGITATCGLVWDNGAQIDPMKLARRLVSRSVSRGLRAFENTRVTSYERGKLRVTGGASVRAKQVVFATGYFARSLLTGPKANTDFCFLSQPIADLGKLKRCHVVENAENYLYLSTFGDRVMVGVEGGHLYGPADRSRRLNTQVKNLVSRVGEVIPDLILKVEKKWASTFVTSPDSLPYLGEVSGYPGAIFALGYGGNGIASSALLAPILVDLVKGKKNSDAEIFRADRQKCAI